MAAGGAHDGPMLWVHDWQGRPCYVPVEAVERRYIPEGWLALDWIVLTVHGGERAPGQPSNDQLAMTELMALGLPVIMPVGVRRQQKRASVSSQRHRKRFRGYAFVPYRLMPDYLLVGLAANDIAGFGALLARIDRHCRHVAGIVGSGSRPIRLGRAAMARFAAALNDGYYDESVDVMRSLSDPKPGDRVEILAGPFEMREAIVEKLKAQRIAGKPMLTSAFVRLRLFGGERLTEIPLDSLRRCG